MTTIQTASLTNASKLTADKIYLITRSSKNAHLCEKHGWIYEPDLAPDWNLFNLTKQLKEQDKWNQEAFNKIYMPEFYSNLYTNQRAIDKIQEMIDAIKTGKSLGLICYCGDHNMCHRNLIADILHKMTNGCSKIVHL